MDKVPFTKKELEDILMKVSIFIRLCGRHDSLGRVYAWGGLRDSILKVLKEEEMHSFTYPSLHNPVNKII